MTDVRADGRALLLFEQLAEHPERRGAILADEAPEVIAAVAALEEAAPRARVNFPTEEDRRQRARPMPLPEQIGAYRLGERLGEGGMGLVFAAERCDGVFEHRVAIKLIHPDRLSDRAVERFAEERRLLARLDHPGIARLIDGGVAADGWPYIIMERIDGLPIDEAAAALSSMAARIALLEQVCDAVSAAHAALVVHGDIKPANVLVGRAGRTRLLDFGVARLIDGAADAGAGPITIAFASPALRGGAAPTVLDDIYALGVMLRALASAGLADAHLLRPADADIAAIADQAAHADPARRYRSVDALATDLARWRATRPVTARPPLPAYVFGRFMRRNARGLAVGGVAVVALLTLAALSIAGWQAARERNAVAAARTGDLRQIARFQIVTLASRLEHQPRSTALRRDLVSEAESVLASAVAAPGASPALLREAAQGYRMLAAIDGAPDRPSLGDTPGAERNLDRGAALVAADGSGAGRAVAAAILLDRAKLAGWSGQPGLALQMLRRAEAIAPKGEQALATDIALLRADTLIWNGDYAAAAALARRIAGDAQGSPDTINGVLRRDRTTDRLAEATYYLGDLAGSLSLYRRAATDLESAKRRWPGSIAIDWGLARQRWNMATVLIDLGRPREALPALYSARDEMMALVAADPDDAMTARRLRSYTTTLAYAEAALGRFAPAIATMEANVAARRRWQAAAPANIDRIRDLSIGIAALGDIHKQAGHRRRACDLYAEVGTIHARLASRGRLSKLDSGYFAGLVRKNARELRCIGTFS